MRDLKSHWLLNFLEGLLTGREAVCRDLHKYECAVVEFCTLGLSVNTAKQREIDVSFGIFIQSSRIHSLQTFNNFICIHWTRSTFKGKVCKDDFQRRWMSTGFGPFIQSRRKKYDR